MSKKQWLWFMVPTVLFNNGLGALGGLNFLTVLTGFCFTTILYATVESYPWEVEYL